MSTVVYNSITLDEKTARAIRECLMRNRARYLGKGNGDTWERESYDRMIAALTPSKPIIPHGVFDEWYTEGEDD